MTILHNVYLLFKVYLYMKNPKSIRIDDKTKTKLDKLLVETT